MPLDVKVVPGGEGDSPQAKPLLKGAKERHPEIRIDSASMDAAYDSYENYRFAIEDIGAAPVIALNPRGRVDAITEGSLYLSGDGTYTCYAGFRVVYWGKDKGRGRLTNSLIIKMVSLNRGINGFWQIEERAHERRQFL